MLLSNVRMRANAQGRVNFNYIFQREGRNIQPQNHNQQIETSLLAKAEQVYLCTCFLKISEFFSLLSDFVQCALNLNLICIKKVLIELNKLFFLYALVLTLLTKFVPNSTIRRGNFCNIFFFNFDSKLEPNLHLNVMLV